MKAGFSMRFTDDIEYISIEHTNRRMHHMFISPSFSQHIRGEAWSGYGVVSFKHDSPFVHWQNDWILVLCKWSTTERIETGFSPLLLQTRSRTYHSNRQIQTLIPTHTNRENTDIVSLRIRSNRTSEFATSSVGCWLASS